MKLCPACLRCYEDDETSCHGDQSTLVPSRHGTRLIADKYRLDRLLGRGGMGAVYAGTHLDLDRPVAIKLLLPDFTADPDALERFRREARAAARLNHPNVADTYDYGVLSDGGAYIVMEMVEGQTLREYMDASGPIPFAEALLVGDQIAEGIEAAHRRDIIHRDLKPSNIILTRDHQSRLQAKIVDFGVAKLKEQTTSGGLTASGSLIGTPRYMSPEQCAGQKIDGRSDIYSLGVILYEMLAGRPPFDAPTATAIALKHLQAEPPPLSEFRPDVPTPVGQFVRQALAKDPNERPQTAAEFALKLREFAGGEIQFPLNTMLQQGTTGSAMPDESLPSDGQSLRPSASKITNRSGAPTFEHLPELGKQDEPSVRGFSHQPPPLITETQTRAAEAPLEGVHLPADDPSEALQTKSGEPPVINESSSRRAHTRRRLWMVAAPLAAILVTLSVLLSLSRANRDQATPTSNINSEVTPGQSTPIPPVGAPINSETAHNGPSAESVAPSNVNISKPDSRAELSAALDGWVAATNSRDLDRQLDYYAPTLAIFYTKRNVSQAAVRAEKRRLFAQISSIEVRTTQPEIRLSGDGLSATMRFRKSWNYTGTQSQNGEVLQELGWRKFDSGWKIISERDAQIIRVSQ